MREIIAQYGGIWIALTVGIGLFGLLRLFPFGDRQGILSYAGSCIESQLQEKEVTTSAFDEYWRKNEKYDIGDDGESHSA